MTDSAYNINTTLDNTDLYSQDTTRKPFDPMSEVTFNKEMSRRSPSGGKSKKSLIDLAYDKMTILNSTPNSDFDPSDPDDISFYKPSKNAIKRIKETLEALEKYPLGKEALQTIADSKQGSITLILLTGVPKTTSASTICFDFTDRNPPWSDGLKQIKNKKNTNKMLKEDIFYHELGHTTLFGSLKDTTGDSPTGEVGNMKREKKWMIEKSKIDKSTIVTRNFYGEDNDHHLYTSSTPKGKLTKDLGKYTVKGSGENRDFYMKGEKIDFSKRDDLFITIKNGNVKK